MRSPASTPRSRSTSRREDVYLVLGGRGKVTVSVDGKPTKTVDVDSYKLYTLRSGSKATQGLMTLAFTPGVQAYAFTFG